MAQRIVRTMALMGLVLFCGSCRSDESGAASPVESTRGNPSTARWVSTGSRTSASAP